MTTRIAFDPNAKRTGPKREESEQVKRMFLADDPFQIDKWYNACKDHTFETRSFPLTLEQVKGIKFMCEYFKLYKQHRMSTNTESGLGLTLNFDSNALQSSFQHHIQNPNTPLSYSWGEHFDWKALTAKSSEQYVNPLKELEQQINDTMAEMKCDDAVFIRLNTRSPKDSAIEGIKTYQLLFQELKEWDKINRNGAQQQDDSPFLKVNDDQITTSFYRSCIKSLAVRNGAEAIELLCRSYERVFHDLNLAMLKQGEDKLEIQCTIRKWDNAIDPIWEFRLVVKDYVPTALTQYHKYNLIPRAKVYKSFMEQRILKEFEEIKGKISKELKDYTIDFAVILKDETIQNVPVEDVVEEEMEIKEDPIAKVVMIEINHEPPSAGTALFNFRDEEDRKILNGEKPFEFRVLESTDQLKHETLDEVLPDHMLEFLSVLRNDSKDTKDEANERVTGRKCILL